MLVKCDVLFHYENSEYVCVCERVYITRFDMLFKVQVNIACACFYNSFVVFLMCVQHLIVRGLYDSVS